VIKNLLYLTFNSCRVSWSQVWHAGSFVVVFLACVLDSIILVFIFLCILIYEMMTVSIQ